MSATLQDVTTARRPAGLPLFLALIATITVIRLIGLHASIVDLYVDESQYWSWSREPAFGYFSKPPMIAWIIAVSEMICGSGEACVRAASPIIYFGTSLIVYAIGRTLYDERTGFWAGILTILAPGVIFSARIISTDVPLLFFWALALLAFVKLRSGGGGWWGLLLAAAIGLGLLSKYAMAFFVAGIVVAAIVDQPTRHLLRRPTFLLAIVGGFLLLVPNILWNVDNGFLTFRHVGDNAGSSFTLDPGEGLEFIAAQFAVAGPIVFAVLLVLVVRLGTTGVTACDRMLVAFALPPLATITVVAFLGKSNANWTATAFISTFVVVAAVLVRTGSRKLLAACVAIGIAVQSILLVTDTMADRLTYPDPIEDDVYRRTMGGAELGRQVADIAARLHVDAVVADGRKEIAALVYYLRDTDIAVYAWPPRRTVAGNHFELTRPLTPDAATSVLMISRCFDDNRVQQQFAVVDPPVRFEVRRGPKRSTTYFAVHVAAVGDAPLVRPPRCRRTASES